MEIPDCAGNLFSEDVLFYHLPERITLNLIFNCRLLNNELCNHSEGLLLRLKSPEMRCDFFGKIKDTKVLLKLTDL